LTPAGEGIVDALGVGVVGTETRHGFTSACKNSAEWIGSISLSRRARARFERRRAPPEVKVTVLFWRPPISLPTERWVIGSRCRARRADRHGADPIAELR
jgi:hypothetical protein